MSVTVIRATENIQAADPQNFTHGVAGDTPKGIAVVIAHGTVSTDIVVGVTFGGQALTRIRSNVDTATEPGRSYIYFLGSGVPTGAQTVSVDRTQSTTTVFVVAISLAANADTESIANNGIDENVANPQVTLAFTGREAMSFCVLYGGGAGPASYTSLSDQTRVHDHDFGAFTAVVDRLTTAQTADDTIGYTAASDDVAFSAFAVAEAVPPAQTISAAGAIASGEAFGTAKTNLSLLAVGALASGEVFGSTVVIGPQTVGPAGAIASSEVFGTLKEILALGPAGAIGTAEAFGAGKINLTLLLAGIISAEAIGALTVIIDQTVIPSAIASAEALGTPTLGTLLVATAIVSAEAFGTIQQLARTLGAGSVVSGEAFGTTRFVLSVRPTGIASAELLGSAQLSLRLLLAGIASGELIGTLSVSGGAGQVIVPTSITSGEAFGALVMFLRELIAQGAVRVEVGADEQTVFFDDPSERTIADVADTKVQN